MGADRLAWIEHTARQTEAPESLSAGLGAVSAMLAMLGDRAGARRLMVELLGRADVGTWWWFTLLPTLVRRAIGFGDVDLAAAINRHSDSTAPMAENAAAAGRAAILEARGDLRAAVDVYADAIERWEAQGMAVELAFVDLGRGRSLRALGQTDDARHALERARAVFTELKATPALDEMDALLGGAPLALGES